MWSRFQHLKRDERGMSFAFVGLGFLAFFAASTIAIDVGMFMTAKSQAQTSADAGALAGATALVFNDYNNRLASGPAVQSAMNTALANAVMRNSVSVTPTDVTFPVSPGGLLNRIRVDVYRTASRNNPVATLVGPVFGVPIVDIIASATAEAAPANAVTCVKPFTIPDKWIEVGNPPWTPNSTFDRYDNHGNVLPNADIYIRPGQPGYVGYNDQPPPVGDRGTVLTIRAGTGVNIAPSFYYSWKMDNAIGGDFYRENIANCNWAVFVSGYMMTQEPGNKVGETTQGVTDLLLKDPTAVWNPTSQTVQSPMNPSARVFPIPLFDPDRWQFEKQNGRTAIFEMVNWLGFFVEDLNGNDVTGRIVPITGVIDPNAGPAPNGLFPKAIRLVQ